MLLNLSKFMATGIYSALPTESCRYYYYYLIIFLMIWIYDRLITYTDDISAAIPPFTTEEPQTCTHVVVK